MNSISQIENVIGTIFNDYMVGDSNVNNLNGNFGDDFFMPLLGNDLVNGSAGNDTVSY